MKVYYKVVFLNFSACTKNFPRLIICIKILPGENLFVCLGFSSYSRIFHSYGVVTISGEGLEILTYARHSWPFFSVSHLL